ncbi:MAG: protease SohB [Polyangia bacterium]|nr:protease SohB [Polyangia bacterium]
MEFLTEFGLFFAKAVGLALVVFLLAWLLARLFSRGPRPAEGRLRVEKLNSRLKALRREIRARTLPGGAFKRLMKEERRSAKEREAKAESGAERRPRIYVLDFEGDLRASAIESLRQEVTAVLTAAEPGDEVVLRLDSGGGLVHAYGLAASQLDRLRARSLRLTVCVDRIAASGGYLMACVADRILAAPFAVVGSIGVVATVPNLSRLLDKHDVDVELHTAGQYKRTLTVLGKNTEEGRAKFKEQLEDAHGLFKAFLASHRPSLDLGRVATGEHWHGTQGLALGLVDALGTSDDLLLEASERADLFRISWERRQTIASRISGLVDSTARRLARSAWQSAHDARYV